MTSCEERMLRKARNLARYRRQYARSKPAPKVAAKGPFKPHQPVGGRYSIYALRDAFEHVEGVVRGFEHVLAQRSKCFVYRPSESKYQPHQGAQEMARRASRGW